MLPCLFVFLSQPPDLLCVIITTQSTAFNPAHVPLSIVPENDDNDDLSKLVSAGSLEPWASTRADEVASGSPSYFLQLRRQGTKIVSGSPQLTTGQLETLSPAATGENKSHFLKQLHHAAATQAQMVTRAPATSCRDNRRCSRQKKLPIEEKKLTCSRYRLKALGNLGHLHISRHSKTVGTIKTLTNTCIAAELLSFFFFLTTVHGGL